MQEKGSLDQILKKYAPAPQICPDMTGEALGFNSCITAFLVLMAGATTGLILLAIELVSRKTGWNWAWLEWYNKDSKIILSLDTDKVEDDEEAPAKPGPSIHAWVHDNK